MEKIACPGFKAAGMAAGMPARFGGVMRMWSHGFLYLLVLFFLFGSEKFELYQNLLKLYRLNIERPTLMPA
jgi:hypothetical protein